MNFSKFVPVIAVMCFSVTAIGAPTVKFEWASAYDSVLCEQSIEQETIQKLEGLLPDWEILWNLKGRPFLDESEKVFKKNFKTEDLVASFTLCPTFAPLGISHPLLFNGLVFSQNPPSAEKHTIFLNIIYHEILHRFLDENFNDLLNPLSKKRSPLMRKYIAKGENSFVLSHLHLFALQKAVYASRAMMDEWNAVESWIQNGSATDYKRALEIVTLEGAEAFTSELLNSN